MHTATLSHFDASPASHAEPAGRAGPVLHLLDDPALGAVTQLMHSLACGLGGDRPQQHRLVTTDLQLARRYPASAIVVHIQMGWRKLPFLWTLRQLNHQTRIILVEHTHSAGYLAQCVTAPGRFRFMLRLAYGMVDEVVAVSQGQAQWLLASGLVPRDRLRMIPAIPDVTPFIALPSPDTSRRPMRLGAIGRFDRQAGFDILVEAMRHVSPADAQLVICGRGEMEAELRHRAHGMPHVAVAGQVDPTKFVAAVDAVVMPSLWGAAPTMCWQARAAGRPLIVTAVDGLAEQVRPDRGFVVPAGDVEALGNAIRCLAAADRARMSDAARRSMDGRPDRAVGRWRTLLSPTRKR